MTVCTTTGRLKRVILDMPFFHDFTQPKSLFTSLLITQLAPGCHMT